MIKSKTKKLLALLAVGAVMTTAAAGVAFSRNFGSAAAFADTGIEDEITGVPGSQTNPASASLGANVITKMVVKDNKMLNYKELVYYMTFTPAQSGVYSFTHNNPDVGVVEVYSEDGTTFGDWNEDMTVYTIELTEGVTYTVLINNFDWSVDLEEYDNGAEYTLPVSATITIAYEGLAAGSTKETAIPYTIGDTIFVSEGHAPVWYTFTVDSDSAANYYVIVTSGSASVRKALKNVTVSNTYYEISDNGTYYIQAIPTETEYAQVQVLDAAEQTPGSCIVTAQAIPEDGVVGGGKWYTYTVGESGKTVSLTPIDNAPVIVTEYKDEEGNVVFTSSYTVVGSVKVYDGYSYLDNLYDGGTLTLEASKTYYFYAPDDIYEDWNDEGEVVATYNVQSKLVIE